MLINSIEVTNFRVFEGKQRMDFSADREKNVTIILADNGTGKTTLGQAFSWCLYGETTFKKANDLLSFSVRDSLAIGDTATVSVELSITHKGTDFFIARSQEYRKDSNCKFTAYSPVLHVSHKEKDGQVEYVESERDKEEIVNRIMPHSISSYFFFDGERVEKMGNEIQKGRSDEFKIAVDNLLGLSAISEAIRHLKGTPSMVIGSYNKDYNENSDKDYQRAVRQIEAAENRINDLNSKVMELRSEKSDLEKRRDDYKAELVKGAETKEWANERDRLYTAIQKAEDSKNRIIKTIMNRFCNQAWPFFADPLLRSAIKAIEDSSIEIKEAPQGVTADTIRDILKRECCLCGTHFEIGSKEYQALNAWFSIVPPEHMGAALKNYQSACRRYLNNNEGLVEEVRLQMDGILDADELISDHTDCIARLDGLLAGAKDLSRTEQLYQTACRKLAEIDERLDNANKAIGQADNSLREAKRERDGLETNDATNKRVRRDRDYAERIFEAFKSEHSAIERRTREDLESCINEIFKEFFDGSLSLSLDSKYNVRVGNKDSESVGYDVETSEGQTVAVIFAFIAGVIKLATNAEREKDEMLISEAYPLVMDAPMSKLDKKRIASVCSVMPRIAEQVVIMIKDTDGELAHDYLKDKIGREYHVIPVVPQRVSSIERSDA